MALLLSGACSTDKKPTAPTPSKPHIPIDKALQRRLADFAAQPRVKGQFAFHVYDLTADRTVYGHNPTQALPSASNMKIISGIAGLHLLGTHYAYTTGIYTRGRVSQGMLHGDIAFRAGLDPQLQPADLAMFAKALRQKGIGKVEGRFYIDLTITEPVESEEHWYPWDLAFSQYGLLYKGEERVARDLKATMRSHGISLADSQVVLGTMPRGMRCIFVLSRDISHITRRMWKNSSNTQATGMLYTIGHKANPNANPVLAGVAYMQSFVRDTLGLKDSTLVIHDGCGLCTHNHLSPLALTTALRFGYHHKSIYERLRSDLSVAGVDGTLAREMTKPATRGKILAKTGTLSHPYGISSLAGYCTAANGHLLAFAIMDSEMSVLDARVLQRKLCEAMVAK